MINHALNFIRQVIRGRSHQAIHQQARIIDGRILAPEPEDLNLIPEDIIDLTIYRQAQAEAPQEPEPQEPQAQQAPPLSSEPPILHPDQILLRDGRVILRENIIRHDEHFGGWWHNLGGLSILVPQSNILAVQRGERIIPAPTADEIEEELRELASYDAKAAAPETTAPETITAPTPETTPEAEADDIPDITPDPAPEERRVLTPQEADLFRATARRLCSERERDGIWIGLLLNGISVSKITKLKLVGKAHVEEATGKRHKIPAWLHNAMNLIEAKQWRRSRNIIHKELKKYEITPSLLNTATHR